MTPAPNPTMNPDHQDEPSQRRTTSRAAGLKKTAKTGANLARKTGKAAKTAAKAAKTAATTAKVGMALSQTASIIIAIIGFIVSNFFTILVIIIILAIICIIGAFVDCEIREYLAPIIGGALGHDLLGEIFTKISGGKICH